MFTSIKKIIVFKKYFPVFIFLIFFSIILAIVDALSLISLASLGTTLISDKSLFNNLFGISYSFTVKENLILILVLFLLKNILVITYNLLQYRINSNLIAKYSKILFKSFLTTTYVKNIKKNPQNL